MILQNRGAIFRTATLTKNLANRRNWLVALIYEVGEFTQPRHLVDGVMDDCIVNWKPFRGKALYFWRKVWISKLQQDIQFRKMVCKLNGHAKTLLKCVRWLEAFFWYQLWWIWQFLVHAGMYRHLAVELWNRPLKEKKGKTAPSIKYARSFCPF